METMLDYYADLAAGVLSNTNGELEGRSNGAGTSVTSHRITHHRFTTYKPCYSSSVHIRPTKANFPAGCIK
jgi:hypothetical protein